MEIKTQETSLYTNIEHTWRICEILPKNWKYF